MVHTDNTDVFDHYHLLNVPVDVSHRYWNERRLPMRIPV